MQVRQVLRVQTCTETKATDTFRILTHRSDYLITCLYTRPCVLEPLPRKPPRLLDW